MEQSTMIRMRDRERITAQEEVEEEKEEEKEKEPILTGQLTSTISRSLSLTAGQAPKRRREISFMIKPDKKAKGKEVNLATAVIRASSSLDESLGSSLERGLSQLTSTGAS